MTNPWYPEPPLMPGDDGYVAPLTNGAAPNEATPDEPRWLAEQDAAEPHRNIPHPGVGAVAVRSRVTVLDLGDFFAQVDAAADEEWLVEGLVPANGLTIVGGDPKTGKTLFALDLGFAVASGGTFLDRETAQASFLYVTEEGSPAEMRKRLLRLVESRPPVQPVRIAYRQGVRLDDDVTWAAIREAVEALPKPALVVLDPLRELIIGDENDSTTINAVGRAIRGLLADFPGTTVVLLHHLSKRREGGKNGGHRLRGSSALWGAADCTLLFLGEPPSDEGGEVTLKGEIFVEPRNAAKALLRWEWDLRSGRFEASESAGGPIADRAFDHLLVSGPTSTNRLAEALGTTPASIRTTLTRQAHRARFRPLLNSIEAERTDADDKSQVWEAVTEEENEEEVFGS